MTNNLFGNFKENPVFYEICGFIDSMNPQDREFCDAVLRLCSFLALGNTKVR